MADRRELVPATGQNLVWISLMADVPEDLVARRIEHRMKSDREFAGTEVRAEVPPDLTDGVDDVLAHLLRHLLKLCVIETVEVLRAVDCV
uniref:Unannotated protein n=1 Tax=freshwater metagenome TaxID=449393 RepID=A0A6J6A146_9ZZZZ